MTIQAPRHRALALRTALARAQSIGPFSIPVLVGVIAGWIASAVVDTVLYGRVGVPWRQLADTVAFAGVAAPVWLAVQDGRVRSAHEVLAWLNGWETDRWSRELGRRLPSVPRAMPGLMDALPDTLGLRPLRIELLALRGELDEARRRLDLLPADTPWQRFERAALDEWIAFLADDPARTAAMHASAAEVDDEERRLVAAATIGAAVARRAAVDRADAIGPLAAVRAQLGDRPRRYAYPYAVGVVLSFAVVGVVASLAVLVTATVIR